MLAALSLQAVADRGTPRPALVPSAERVSSVDGIDRLQAWVAVKKTNSRSANLKAEESQTEAEQEEEGEDQESSDSEESAGAEESASATNWCGEFKDSRALRQTLGAPSEGYASCAVVGSAGILTLERLGERIDSAELVIRFNLQAINGFEPIVGKRISLRSINTETIGFILAEHVRDIHAGGETLRRFQNASWCPAYPVYLNSGHSLHRAAFRAVCSGVTTIIDNSAFDEHNAVLESLGPKDANLMSGQLGLALATMLCPKGVDVYGVTHAGTQNIARKRELPYHYFDANAQLNSVDSLDDSARLLSLFAEVTWRGFISAHAHPRPVVCPFQASLALAHESHLSRCRRNRAACGCGRRPKMRSCRPSNPTRRGKARVIRSSTGSAASPRQGRCATPAA